MFLHRLSEEIPLGDPLQDTVLEVHDDVGNIVTEGTGTLWIGIKYITESDYPVLEN
jgi:hypothetical protein